MEKSQLSMEYILILAGAILITIAVGIAIKTALHEETPSIQMSGSKVFSGMIIKAAFDCSQCDNRFVNVIGDIMKGDLNMNWHDILNVNLITGKKLKFDEGDFNKLYVDTNIEMPNVIIRGDGGISTGLNADKLDGYDASGDGINDSHAKQIIDFVIENLDSDVFVSCDAGISRSPSSAWV